METSYEKLVQLPVFSQVNPESDKERLLWLGGRLLLKAAMKPPHLVALRGYVQGLLNGGFSVREVQAIYEAARRELLHPEEVPPWEQVSPL